MIKYLFFLLSLFPALTSAQQLAASFQEATEVAGLKLEQLDKEYQPALHADPELAFFKGQEEEFIDAYKICSQTWLFS